MEFHQLPPSDQEAFVDELARRCLENPWCRKWSREVDNHTPAYAQALETLTPQQREAVEDYIAACEELEYARIFVAYTIGREHQQKGIPPFPQD